MVPFPSFSAFLLHTQFFNFFLSHMDDRFTTREYGWTKSSGSKSSFDPLAEEIESDSGSSGDQDIPFA